ncbi:MAG: hypothetical protein M3477_06845 [Gemmatimonadota bacterium]|nr:hypothetical protein [Gemmatimonadota bacterium]
MTNDVSATFLFVTMVSVATLEVSEASSLRFDAHATKPKISIVTAGLTHIARSNRLGHSATHGRAAQCSLRGLHEFT